ncbi:hypothetical protein MRB53_027279 [Persea americana]|uniref:Uncharacterized protein n=1 Tax=Persea americana TaxID=3435 RepID=A0ACC2LLB1_PERAE|nr:hypothetical protein MRB53_027279 [Persea americana]
MLGMRQHLGSVRRTYSVMLAGFDSALVCREAETDPSLQIGEEEPRLTDGMALVGKKEEGRGKGLREEEREDGRKHTSLERLGIPVVGARR